MARPWFLAALLALAACASAPATPDRAADCAAAVADHDDIPAASVSTETRLDGSVVAVDGSRLHVCRFDADGRVASLEHPR